MAATRIYSTAAYYVAAIVAVLFGLCPKFGALIAATPGGVLGGITVVLYGMIGLLGAKIWIENRVDFANPINLVPIGAGIILAVGPVAHQISDYFTLEGIALGTIVLLAGYHLLRWLAPEGSGGIVTGIGNIFELVANLALRTGKAIHWDAGVMEARGCPEASPAIRRAARSGRHRPMVADAARRPRRG